MFQLPKIDAPTGLTATTNLDRRIELEWDSCYDSDSIKIYRSESEAGPFTLLAEEASYSSFHSDRDLEPMCIYYYYITKVSSGTESAPSVVATGGTVLSPPNDINFSNTYSSVKLYWTVLAKADSYRVYKKQSSYESFSLLGEVTDAEYTDETATTTTCYYAVSSVSGDIESAKSETVAASTSSLPAPQNFTLVSTYDGITASWSPVTGASEYEIYSSSSSYSSFNLEKTTGGTEYSNNSGVSASSTRYYKVRAKLADGTAGSWSTTESGKRLSLAAPSAPTIQWAAWPSLGISWAEVEGALSYELYRSTSSSTSAAQTLVATVTSGTSYAEDTSAITPGTWYYRVVAKRNDYASSLGGFASKWVMGNPAITNVTDRGNALRVTWPTSSAPSSVQCVVYRSSAADGTYESVGSANASAGTFDDATIALGGTFFYKIAYRDGAIETTTSADKSATSNGTIGGLIATNSTELNAITVSWTSLGPLVDTYSVYTCETQAGTYVKIGDSIGANSYQHSGLVKGEARWYKVVGVKSGSEIGALSGATAVSGRAFGAAPPAITVESNAYQSPYYYIRLTWPAVAGAKRYMIGIYNTSDTLVGNIVVSGSAYFTARNIMFDPPNSDYYHFRVFAIHSSTGDPTVEEVSEPGALSSRGYAF